MSIESRSRQYGKVFDHWQIREFLGSGSGGKSAVFRLVHADSGSVQSALKVISLIDKRGDFESLSESRKTDYERVKQKCKDCAKQEVLLMNDLQGRTNVVDYLDHTFVDWADENGFGCDMLIRMELLKDLRSEIEADHVFRQEEVLKIGRDICTALVLCHSKNILHRDIKPENIFFNEDGNYKLGDFGVSRILSAAPMSKASTGVCTPEYAAPEQMSGKYDTRVDIYSLGLVLYELSNGNRLPFATSSYITEWEVQGRMLGKPLPAPCNASKFFADVILKACAFDPNDRYQTAEDFLADLNLLAGGNPRPLENRPSVNRGTQKATPAVSGNATQYAEPDTPRKLSRENDYADPRLADSDFPRKAPTGKPDVLKMAVCALAVVILIILGMLIPGYFSKENDNTLDQTNSGVGSETGSLPETIHAHTWQDATCTQAKTCLDCGATEGDAAGHDWVAATTLNPKTCSLCGMTEGSPILDIVAGDTITMGYYGNEYIRWTVLEFDSATNQALLISEYCLDAMPFHTGSDYGSWENSTLRKWLNNEFISKAFDQEERAAILTKTISNPDNADYGTDSGKDTTDRVFLLSYEEAVYYFPSKTSRQGTPTEYCKEQGCYDPVKYGQEHGTEVSPEAVGHTWWWLRTAGADENQTCNVVAKGSASTYGARKTSDDGAVRPAMWVQLG